MAVARPSARDTISASSTPLGLKNGQLRYLLEIFRGEVSAGSELIGRQ